MFCVFCGSERSNDAVFCHKCGRRVFVENIEDVIGEMAYSEDDEYDDAEADGWANDESLQSSELEDENLENNHKKKSKAPIVVVMVALVAVILAGVGVFVVKSNIIHNIYNDDASQPDLMAEQVIEDDISQDINEKLIEDDTNQDINKDVVADMTDVSDLPQKDLDDDLSGEDLDEASTNDEATDTTEITVPDNQVDEGHSDLYIKEYKAILKAPDKWLSNNLEETFKAKKYTYGLYNVCGDSTPELLISAGPYKKYGRGESAMWYVISCTDESGAYLVAQGEIGVTDTLQIYNGKLASIITNGTNDLYIEHVVVDNNTLVMAENLYTGYATDDLSANEIISLNYGCKSKEPFEFVE